MSSLKGSSVVDQLDIVNQKDEPDGKGLKRESIAKLSVPDSDPAKGIKLAVCVMNGQEITSLELKGPKGFKPVEASDPVTDEARTTLKSGNNDLWFGFLIDRKNIPSPFQQTDTKLKLKPALPVPQRLEWVVAYETDPLVDAHVKGHSQLAPHGRTAAVEARKAKAKKPAKKKTASGKSMRGRKR